MKCFRKNIYLTSILYPFLYFKIVNLSDLNFCRVKKSENRVTFIKEYNKSFNESNIISEYISMCKPAK